MYLPVASGSIVGILKQMHDEMSGDEASATKEEEESIKAYEGLMAAKTKEVNALTAQIEVEMKRLVNLVWRLQWLQMTLKRPQPPWENLCSQLRLAVLALVFWK